MQKDFHYYACYAAAILAGYGHEEALEIAYSNQFVDVCTPTLIAKVKGPKSAATSQSQAELMDARTDLIGLQEITRIWASFHFLPYDLYTPLPRKTLIYKNKYRLICDSNGELVVDTVKLAKDKGLVAAGIAMHVLSDTWAHKYFAGTPSLVINNTNYHFYETLDDGTETAVTFRHSVKAPDDIDSHKYTNSMYMGNETSVMNLGHGRAGHLPDYSFAKYTYMPAWGNFRVIEKDNPSDYLHAFAQMIYALRYLRGDTADFEKEKYDFDAFAKYRAEVEGIIRKRQLIACEDWKKFGEELSGQEIPDFDEKLYQQEYMSTPREEKDETFLGKFFQAGIAQKNMVTEKIFKSGNLCVGFYKGLKFKKQMNDRFFQNLHRSVRK